MEVTSCSRFLLLPDIVQPSCAWLAWRNDDCGERSKEGKGSARRKEVTTKGGRSSLNNAKVNNEGDFHCLIVRREMLHDQE